MITKTSEEIRSLIECIVKAAGTPEDIAKVVADVLAGSHLAGHDSHGIQHLPRYIRELCAGEIAPDARPEILSETPSAALVRGNWGWGHFTADWVTRLAIEKARKNKIFLASAVEVHHIGRLGHFVERAAAEGVIAILCTGGNSVEKQSAAPYGGRKAVLSPNPIGIGFPTVDGEPPVILDIATTKVAGGKVALARAKGEQVPPGWIIDKEGNPTTDPNDFYSGGAYLPFGEHKGFGLMVALEILGRILAGADAYANTHRGGVSFRHVGMTLIAIDSAAFSPAREFAARTTELVHRIQAVPPARGFSDVMAPGDFEHRKRNTRRKEGIQIPDSTWHEVVQTAESLGLRI